MITATVVVVLTIIQVALRIVLGSATLALTGIEYSMKAGKRVSKLANSAVAKAVKTKAKKFGTIGKRVANLAIDVGYLAVKGLIRVLKLIIKVFDVLIASSLVVMVLVILVTLIMVISLIMGGGLLAVMADELMGTKPDDKAASEESKVEAASFVSVNNEIGPEGIVQGVDPASVAVINDQPVTLARVANLNSLGMDLEDWNESSDTGRKTATWAIEAIEGGAQGKYLMYGAGRETVGEYNQMGFVAGALSGAGLALDGESLETKNSLNPRYVVSYDKDVNTQENLWSMGTTGAFASWARVNSKVEFTSGAVGWETDLRVGDLLLTDGNVSVYLGKRADGEQMVATVNSTGELEGYDNIAGTKAGKGVIFQKLDKWVESEKVEVSVLRPNSYTK